MVPKSPSRSEIISRPHPTLPRSPGKNLAPAYAEAAGELEKDGLFIAKVDATEHTVVAGKYGIRGFPTLKFFVEGEPLEYQGGRTKDDIVTYVKKKSGPAAATLEDAAAVAAFAKSADVAIVAFIDDAESAEGKAFMSAASSMDDYPFGIAASALGADVEAKAGDIVLFKQFDEGKAIIASTDVEEIKTFVAGQALRLLEVFSAESSRRIFGGPIGVHTLVFVQDDALDALVTEAAMKYRGEVLHVKVPESETRVLDYFGITTDDMPTIMLADMRADMKKYAYEGEITVAGIQAFQEDFFAGKLTPTLKSEEPAEEDLAEPVKVVKGKSFGDIVVDNDKDVLLEFYAPWCGHCKALAPVYDELAAKLSGVDSVVIAKMDATANEVDHPGIAVQGFPTLYFFPGNDKMKPVKYEAGRELDDFVAYLKENASTKFELSAAEEPAAEEPVSEEL